MVGMVAERRRRTSAARPRLQILLATLQRLHFLARSALPAHAEPEDGNEHAGNAGRDILGNLEAEEMTLMAPREMDMTRHMDLVKRNAEIVALVKAR